MEEEIKKRYEEDCKNATFTNEEREKYFYRLKDLQVKLQSLAELFQNPMRITNNMINEYSKIYNDGFDNYFRSVVDKIKNENSKQEEVKIKR